MDELGIGGPETIETKRCKCSSMGGGTPEKWSCYCESKEGGETFGFLDRIEIKFEGKNIWCNKPKQGLLVCSKGSIEEIGKRGR